MLRDFAVKKAVFSYLKEIPFGPFCRVPLVSTSSITEELMQSFRLYANVKEVAFNLLERNGHTARSASFISLQALLRQAVSFFEAAQQMHYRASPLLYYYSFLNAAKAVVLVNNPQVDIRNLMHGLSVRSYSRDLGKSIVSIKKNGAFDILYKNVYGKSPPSGNHLNILKLMSYVAGVSHEYSTLGMGPMRIFGCRLVLVAFEGEHSARGLIAVEASATGQKAASAVLSKTFSRVELSNAQASVIYGIDPIRMKVNTLWETDKPFKLNVDGGYNIIEISNYILSNLRDNISFCPNKTDFLFRIHESIRTPKKMAINELLSIYVITFFLGSCVRYRPEILEQMLNRKSAWLIEAFMRVAPLAFMRQIRNLLDGQYLAYTGE